MLLNVDYNLRYKLIIIRSEQFDNTLLAFDIQRFINECIEYEYRFEDEEQLKEQLQEYLLDNTDVWPQIESTETEIREADDFEFFKITNFDALLPYIGHLIKKDLNLDEDLEYTTCPNCGMSSQQGASYCFNCGQKLN